MPWVSAMSSMPRPSAAVLATPSVQRLARVARALGDVADQVVFIGGAIAPLLQLDPPFPEARPTKDIDGVVASATYTDSGRLADALRARGFTQSAQDSAHIHRWRSPDGDALDLVPSGSHLGGSGQLWDRLAIEHCVEVELSDDLRIRHASAAAFLALKWAAFADRGRSDPWGSHDLEDILALTASRVDIAKQVEGAAGELAQFVAESTRQFLRLQLAEDTLAGHLNNAQDPRMTMRLVQDRLGAIAKLAATEG